MSATYTLKGNVSRIEADMLDASTPGGVQFVPGRTWITIYCRRGNHEFPWEGPDPVPALGTPVTVTMVVG